MLESRGVHLAGRVVRHYKGNLYRVVGQARHTETGEAMVVYYPVGRPRELWVRPFNMFTGYTLNARGEAVYRFEHVDSLKGTPGLYRHSNVIVH